MSSRCRRSQCGGRGGPASVGSCQPTARCAPRVPGLLADAGNGPLEGQCPRCKGSGRCARRAVVPKGVELPAAGAGMRGQGQWESQAPQQEYPKLSTGDGHPFVRRPDGEGTGSMRAGLRQQQRSGCGRQGGEMHPEGALSAGMGSMTLPTAQAVARLVGGSIKLNGGGLCDISGWNVAALGAKEVSSMRCRDDTTGASSARMGKRLDKVVGYEW